MKKNIKAIGMVALQIILIIPFSLFFGIKAFFKETYETFISTIKDIKNIKYYLNNNIS